MATAPATRYHEPASRSFKVSDRRSFQEPRVAEASLDLQHARLLIGGEWTAGVEAFEVFDKFTGDVIGRCERASQAQVDAAVAAAKRSFEAVKLAPYDRYRILMKVAELIEAR